MEKQPNFSELSEQTGIHRTTLYTRWHNGDRGEVLTRQTRKKKSDLPKWITYDERYDRYKYSRTLNGKNYNKATKTLDEIVVIKNEVDDYVLKNGTLPKKIDNRVKIDYDNITGKVFGHLTVVEVVQKNNRRHLRCRCDCGKIKDYSGPQIVDGKVISCGHMERWAMRERNAELKELQRQSDKPLSTNKTTGHKYISYNRGKNAYDFEITRNKIRLRRRFKTLDEAINFKKEVVEIINKNDGKIPLEYL